MQVYFSNNKKACGNLKLETLDHALRGGGVIMIKKKTYSRCINESLILIMWQHRKASLNILQN